MNPLVMAAIIGLSGTSVCCLAGTEHRRLKRTWVAPAVMMAAMILQAVPGVASGPLLIAALLLVVTMPLSVSRPREQVSSSAMQVHRALSALLMAAFIVVGLGLSAGGAGGAGHALAAGGTMSGMRMVAVGPSATGVEVVLSALAVAYLGFSAWTARAAFRARTSAGTFAGVEVATMSAALLVMTVAL
ncbi:hypothetical protein [Frondihabitans cladoniiphilus]|uniref:DUF5134 domain-containing protein n=1 Tax=Frondihabitans cladoniiphilus TaxID=715785 RepID=A0ABP8VHD9_9MICO